MARDVFYFYRSYFEAALKMEPKDQLKLFKGIANYALNGVPPLFTGVTDAVWTIIKPILDKEATDFENGRKGGRGNKKTGVSENGKGGFNGGFNGGFSNTETPSETTNKETNKETITETGKETEKNRVVADAPAAQRFVKPTIQEVASYAAKLGYTTFNAERFYGYYESNGWKVGRNPMKSWRGAVVNWHQREQEEAKPSQDYVSRTQIPDREVFKYVQGTI